jgi:hypothetical protein
MSHQLRIWMCYCLGLNLAVTINCCVPQLLVTAKGFPSSPIIYTLLIEAIRSSEMSALTRATRHHIPEDGILHSHRWENFKSYLALTGWAL